MANGVPACFAVNNDLQGKNGVVASKLGLELSKSLSSLVCPTNVRSKVTKPTYSALPGPKFKIELSSGPTELCLKCGNIGTEDYPPKRSG